MLLDQRLFWDIHISNAARKLVKFLNNMYESQHYNTFHGIRVIHNCFVYSNLIYCNSIWDFSTKSALQSLKVIHEKIVRAVACISTYAQTLDFFNSYSLLVLENTIIY